MNCSLPGSSVHGILQAWILEWVAISFSRASSWPRDRTQVSHIIGRRFTVWAYKGKLIQKEKKKNVFSTLDTAWKKCFFKIRYDLVFDKNVVDERERNYTAQISILGDSVETIDTSRATGLRKRKEQT